MLDQGAEGAALGGKASAFVRPTYLADFVGQPVVLAALLPQIAVE